MILQAQFIKMLILEIMKKKRESFHLLKNGTGSDKKKLLPTDLKEVPLSPLYKKKKKGEGGFSAATK
jgi:hypothetical protein